MKPLVLRLGNTFFSECLFQQAVFMIIFLHQKVLSGYLLSLQVCGHASSLCLWCSPYSTHPSRRPTREEFNYSCGCGRLSLNVASFVSYIIFISDQPIVPEARCHFSQATEQHCFCGRCSHLCHIDVGYAQRNFSSSHFEISFSAFMLVYWYFFLLVSRFCLWTCAEMRCSMCQYLCHIAVVSQCAVMAPWHVLCKAFLFKVLALLFIPLEVHAVNNFYRTSNLLQEVGK